MARLTHCTVSRLGENTCPAPDKDGAGSALHCAHEDLPLLFRSQRLCGPGGRRDRMDHHHARAGQPVCPRPPSDWQRRLPAWRPFCKFTNNNATLVVHCAALRCLCYSPLTATAGVAERATLRQPRARLRRADRRASQRTGPRPRPSTTRQKCDFARALHWHCASGGARHWHSPRSHA